MHTAQVICSPAEDALADLPNASVDAIVTDPPYGVNIGRPSGQTWDSADTVAFRPDFWVEALRVVKPGGLLLAFGSPRTWHRLAVAVEDGGFGLEETVLAWCRADKKLADVDVARAFAKRGDEEAAERFRDCHTMFKPAFEPIIVARRPFDGDRIDSIAKHGVGFLNFTDAYTPTDEDLSRTPGAPRLDGVMRYERGGMDRSMPHAGGRYPHNQVFVHDEACVPEACVPSCSAALYDLQHPGKTRFFRSFYHSGRTPQAEKFTVNGRPHLTVKPVSLMEWLVGIATLPGQRVLDPFCGSGSTLVAARNLGREAIGFERDEGFAALAERRTAA